MNKKTLILGGAVLVGALVLAGGGVALGASDVFDGDDDRVATSTTTRDDARTGERDDRDDSTGVEPTTAATADPADVDAASSAALAAAGDGTVTEVERSDDLDHAWEVEVTFADGRDVEVELDSEFALVRIDD